MEDFDLCFPAEATGDPLIDALLRIVRSSQYRELLGELPSYDKITAGELQGVN